jgi:hypothetical protein
VLVLLAALGVALVALGALVLLRFPDRPGGDLRLLGLEVSSIGAGLPVIALGALLVVVAVAQQRDDGESPTADDSGSGGGGGQVAGAPPADAPACLASFFRTRPTVSANRRRSLPAGTEDVEVLLPAESKREELALVLTDGGEVAGAVKLTYDVDARQFGVDAFVDARCEPVRWTASDVPGPNPSRVNQFSHLKATLEGREYDVELKPNGVFEMELHRVRR